MTRQTFLQKIIEKAHVRVARIKRDSCAAELKRSADNARASAEPHRLRKSLGRRTGANIIAEIKRASPSRGVINADIDILHLAREYESGGAAAISVLTEEEYFHGSLSDLRVIRSSVRVPILRKDFIVDELQVFEAAAAGADAVLLIVAALSRKKLESLTRVSNDLGMDTLVEVHSASEMAIAAEHRAVIVGVNNRDLHTLEVSLDISKQLIAQRPNGTLMVAESGISSRDDIDQLQQLGFDGFLIGERLMRDADPRRSLESWI
jgi:indole-3-glycerol phosphate synthase